MSRASGHGCFLPTQLASWCRQAPCPPRAGVSCLSSTRPAPSPGDSLAGGKEVISSARRWSSSGDQAKVCSCPACLERLSQKEVPGSQEAEEDSGHRWPVRSGLGAWEPPRTSQPLRAWLGRYLQQDALTYWPPSLPISPVSFFLSASYLPSSFLSLYKYLLNHLLCTRYYSRH